LTNRAANDIIGLDRAEYIIASRDGGGRSDLRRVLQAVSISQPVMVALEGQGFAGSVLSLFAEACNLVSDQGVVLALVSQRVGNGPLNIVLEKGGFLARGWEAGSPVEGDGGGIRVGGTWVSLAGAEVWEPWLEQAGLSADGPGLKANLSVLHDHLTAQAPGESLACLGGYGNPSYLVAGPAGGRSVESTYREVAWRAIEGLLAALQVGDRQGIAAGAAALAGLGPGLTPAGDDFLLGLMAGLRTWPPLGAGGGLSVEEACQSIYGAAAGRTNLFSRALLRSASEGLFGEAWHILLAALGQGGADEVREAADRVLGFGATSGADALSGFLAVSLKKGAGT
jgi:hypothetical protein